MLKRVSGQEYESFVAAMSACHGSFRATASDRKLTDTGLVENCTEEKIYAYGKRKGATIIGLRDISGDHWITATYSWIPAKTKTTVRAVQTKANNPISKAYMGIKNTVLRFFKR